ncbi:LytTR family DNA-binding domain-containing protein [soil metagenome]
MFTRYQPWRRYAEIGFWIAFFGIQAVFNLAVLLHDLSNLPVGSKHPGTARLIIWYGSMHFVLLALVPVLIAFERRFPLRWNMLHKMLPCHLFATFVYTGAAVLLTSGLVALIYLGMGQPAPALPKLESFLVYEYLKDFRTYFIVVIILNFYRLLLLRWQGEASLLDLPDEGPPVASIDQPDQFLVKKLGKEFLLPAADIEWIQAKGNYVNLRVRGHDHPLRTTMAALETRLDPARFVRAHRSFIANLDHVLQLEPLESGEARAHMSDGTQVPISRRNLESLHQASARQARPAGSGSTA